jgi:hypothetical protein
MPLDVKLFGYYPGAHCPTCSKFTDCGGKAHQWDFESIKAQLIERFGDRVKVSLINVFSGDVKMYPEIEEHIKIYGLRIPILTLEGEIIAWGGEASDDYVFKIVEYALAEKAREGAAAGQ